MTAERRDRDMELKCDDCDHQTLVTGGSWTPRCRCGGMRRVVKTHDRVLTHAEARALGYGVIPL